MLTQSRLITIVPSKLHAGGSGVRLYDGPDLKLFILVGKGRSFLFVAWPTGFNWRFSFAPDFSDNAGRDVRNEPSRGKTNNVVSEQVRHKPACTVTEKS